MRDGPRVAAKGKGAKESRPDESSLTSIESLRKHFAKHVDLVSRVNTVEPQISATLIQAFKQLEDPTGPVSDALDQLRIEGCVSASQLKPTIQGARIVGPALTLRQVAARGNPYADRFTSDSKLAPMAVHLMANPGDVVVIESCGAASSGGGYAQWVGHLQGEVGAVIDGAVRDVGQSRRLGYPIWVREITPKSGSWRIEAVEINGTVNIAGVQVAPGDLVVADDSGICFVPAGIAEQVLGIAQAIIKKDIDLYGF